MTLIHADICIIGAGAGGLSVAAGAVQLGVSVALVEGRKMGGDCLNYGCVPSKALLATAKIAHEFHRAAQFGIQSVEPQINFDKVMEHVHGVINTLSWNDSVERFTGLGVNVVLAQGKFLNATTLIAGDTTIRARRFVIATGSSPAVPAIVGLNRVPYYTNETIFTLKQKPTHLIIIGGGPIGCELAQAFLLLGTNVTVLEAFTILPHDEKELVSILRDHLIKQGLKLFEGVSITNVVQQQNGQIQIHFEKDGKPQTITGTELLVAAGRKANVEDLNLDQVGVDFSAKGIKVDAHLKTTNKHIYAIGDVIGGYQFTHIANYHAGIVIRNILFRLPTKVNYRAVPWVTFTNPELAHVGLTSTLALKQYPHAKILSCDFSEIDRAQIEGESVGKIQLATTSNGKILGVSILGAQAGELIIPWIHAIQEGKRIRNMTDFIVPYPTLSEIHRKVAAAFYTPLLFSERTRKIVRLLRLLG